MKENSISICIYCVLSIKKVSNSTRSIRELSYCNLASEYFSLNCMFAIKVGYEVPSLYKTDIFHVERILISALNAEAIKIHRLINVNRVRHDVIIMEVVQNNMKTIRDQEM